MLDPIFTVSKIKQSIFYKLPNDFYFTIYLGLKFYNSHKLICHFETSPLRRYLGGA